MNLFFFIFEVKNDKYVCPTLAVVGIGTGILALLGGLGYFFRKRLFGG